MSDNDFETIYDCISWDLDARKLFDEAHKINNASYKRRNRLASHITNMLMLGNCIFITLTFKDNVLNNTTRETRRRYVTRFLKSQSSQYVANIDFGEKNHREHYHAVIMCDNVNNNAWLYGSIDFERIKVNNDAPKRLAKYVCKLTNHAIKNTTKKNYCIYSKSQGA